MKKQTKELKTINILMKIMKMYKIKKKLSASRKCLKLMVKHVKKSLFIQ